MSLQSSFRRLSKISKDYISQLLINEEQANESHHINIIPAFILAIDIECGSRAGCLIVSAAQSGFMCFINAPTGQGLRVHFQLTRRQQCSHHLHNDPINTNAMVMVWAAFGQFLDHSDADIQLLGTRLIAVVPRRMQLTTPQPAWMNRNTILLILLHNDYFSFTIHTHSL